MSGKVKKPIYKRWWFWLIIACIVAAIFSPKDKSEEKNTLEDKPSEQTTEEIVIEEPKEDTLTFVLFDGEVGDYGIEVDLNKGTEFEEREIMYYIPAGSYLVSNLNTKKDTVQVSVYSGPPVKNGEWEEFVWGDTCPNPIVVMSGETKELEIIEGQFVVLSDGGSNIQFTMK